MFGLLKKDFTGNSCLCSIENKYCFAAAHYIKVSFYRKGLSLDKSMVCHGFGMSGIKEFMKHLMPAFLIAVLALSVLVIEVFYLSENQTKILPTPYIGIAFGGNTVGEAEMLIDRVKECTNLFILDSGRNVISRNQSSVEEICDYAFSKGLSFIINLGINDVLEVNETTWFWQQPLNQTKQRWSEMWGSKFLGIYYNDEPGGIQLDGNWSRWFGYWGERLNQISSNNVNSTFHPLSDDLYQIYLRMWDAMNNGSHPQDYDLEAKFFVEDALKIDPGLIALDSAGITAYTSDYALYWWDYLGGYDVLFAQLGWNNSVAEQIALVKGAARLQGKEWGTIITWKYDTVPYLDSGDQIYTQMLVSYQAGAKYIVVFNYPYGEGNNYGAMTDEQFLALQRFWNDINKKSFVDLSVPQAALVLPSNFGWGMRSPNDTIWGFWTTDNRTYQVAVATSKLLAEYGASLDIVYYDPAYPTTKVAYRSVYWWNSTYT
jgi:hypothetical protein